MSNINQGYFDRIRYVLQNKNLGSLIVSEPEGWKSDDKELSRHKDHHGIFPKFSNNLKFYGSGADYLTQVDEIYGVNEDVRLVKDQKHPKTDVWTRVYDGYLDLSTLEKEDGKVSVKFNSGGLESILKSRIDEEVEITRETSIDGNVLEPINEIGIELEGRRIFLKTDWETKPINNSVRLACFSDDGNTRDDSVGFPLSIINQSHEESQSVIPETHGFTDSGTTGMMFFANFDRDRTINVVGKNIKFYPQITDSDWQWAYFRLQLVIYGGGADYIIKETRNIFVAQTSPTGNEYNLYDFYRKVGPLGQYINENRRFEVNFNEILNVEAGDSVALVFSIIADLKNFVSSRARYYVNVFDLSGTVYAEEDSFFEKTNCKAVLPFELADKLLEIYTNNKCLRSNALGRTDLGYQQDGNASLVAQTNGFNIRNFTKDDEVYKPITTSLKDFLESFSSTHVLGMGIETFGFKEYVRIEELSYFYNRNTTIRLINPVGKVKRSVATDYYYSAIEIGSDKSGTYEEAFGLAEYNGKSKFTTIITRLKNVYSVISKYRHDTFGIEFARRKQKLTHATTDTKYDTEIFNLDLKRVFGNIFTLRKWQDDFEQEPTGTFSPETAYNLRLSPLNCLLRHGWIIASGLTKYLSDYVRYASSNGNSSLSTKLIGGYEYAENGNIINSELARPRYLPVYLEFNHEVDFDISQLLISSSNILGKEIPNIYGCIEFINEFGESEKGFLINLKPDKGDWKLLKAY